MDGKERQKKNIPILVVKSSAKTLFVFRWTYAGRVSNFNPPLLIVADNLKTAKKMLVAEDHTLAIGNDKKSQGYRCVQKILLDRDINLNLTLK